MPTEQSRHWAAERDANILHNKGLTLEAACAIVYV
jgi:hypothetical protein